MFVEDRALKCYSGLTYRKSPPSPEREGTPSFSTVIYCVVRIRRCTTGHCLLRPQMRPEAHTDDNPRGTWETTRRGRVSREKRSP